MVHGLLLIIVIVALTGCAGILLAIIGKKAVKMYQENCRDVVSVAVVVTSMAIVVYFGDRIKDIIGLNLMIILLLVQVVYVGIRVYVNGCKKARGYF